MGNTPPICVRQEWIVMGKPGIGAKYLGLLGVATAAPKYLNSLIVYIYREV